EGKAAMIPRALVLCFDGLAVAAQAHAPRPYPHAPASYEYARHDPPGTTILPNGRFLRPVGRHLPVARWPHGLAVSPDGTALFVASDRIGQVVTGWDGQEPKVTRLMPVDDQ